MKEIAKEIEAKESRSRARSAAPHARFEYAVSFLLRELWRNSLSYPPRESSIHLRRGYYSELQRYRDENLTYRQVKAAFDGMVDCRMIEVTTAGFYRRDMGSGELTRFIPTDRLLEKFESLEGHPAFQLKSDTSGDIIILRNKIDGRKQDIDYDDTPKTEGFRSNLTKINDCFVKHWADLRIEDTEVAKLSDRINQDPDKQPIDLSKRTLTRIFTNGSFEEGGRFYRGWWQNVPSEYRKYITIDMKRTVEYDFSQLNPHMLYYAYNKELGEEDAYDRVLDGEHRNLVKSAFNAMIQASSPFQNCPRDIDPSIADMSWSELRDRIIAAHKPIEDLFFRGEGNLMQFEDSCICEGVMLHFAAMDAPALPIHDSFMMHHGFGGELEEAMRREFHKRLGGDIPTSEEMLKWTPADDTPPKTVSVDEILHADKEYSKWQVRHDAWLAQ